jgi:cell division protein ZapA (FtsZ GTPase activity inhibitor)
MMEDLIPVNIVIGDRSYRIRISPADEAAVRGTVKIINDKIVEFKTQFSGNDMQDYIAMVMIWYATQTNNVNEVTNEMLSRALLKVEEQLDKAIASPLA